MRRLRPALLAGLALVAPAPGGLAAQDPDSAAAARPDSLATERPVREGCALAWEPAAGEQTRYNRVRDGATSAFVEYLGGRTLWTCGTATMLADSAVRRQLAARVDLVGNVEYRDTIRTLESTFLTYFETEDRVVATDSVRLERITDGSTLDGPYVEFLRAVSGVNELTIATGRPHMTLTAEGEERGPPFEIDSDRAVFAGEEEARAYGDVVISREDLNAEADSAYLTRGDELGVLWGSPWVEAEGIRLEGDTIRFRSEGEELREVHALGDGHAIGESFEVRSEIIDAWIVEEQPEIVWSHGSGLSEAVSGDHNVFGDSLRFVMFDGRIDTVYAVGEAVAIQSDGPLALARLGDAAGPASDSLTAPADSAMSTPADSARVGSASDSARAERDSVAAATDSVAAATDSVAVVPDSALAAAPDPGAAAPDSSVASDSLPGDDAAPAGRIRAPVLTVDGRANWVRGDTLIAVFVRQPVAEPVAPPAPAPADTTGAGEAPETEPQSDDPGPEPQSDDPEPDPRMERLIVYGNASSFYRQVRDSTQSTVASRNYMIGKRIEIIFSDGEPELVKGFEAIGLYLDPEATETGAPPPVPPDTTTAASDTSAAARDTAGAVRDTRGTARGTIGTTPAPPAGIRRQRPREVAWRRRA